MGLPIVFGFRWRESGGIVWLESGPPGVRVAFVTRLDGTSCGRDLDVSMRDPVAGAVSRGRLWDALGVASDSIAWAPQVHGREVAVVGRPGKAAHQADVLVTRSSGITLFGQYADCVPVVIWDRAVPAVALAHAGWRGTAAGAVTEAVSALARLTGGSSRGFEAAIGPSIGPCCYEVGPDVLAALGLPVDGPRRVDLGEINRQQLVAGGVCPQGILRADVCTSCRSDLFFSHRRSGGRTGRFAVVVAIEGSGEHR